MQRRARAVDDARVEVAAELVGAEPMVAPGASSMAPKVLRVGS